METMEAIRKRKSLKNCLSGREIEREKLEQVPEAARLALSPINTVSRRSLWDGLNTPTNQLAQAHLTLQRELASAADGLKVDVSGQSRLKSRQEMVSPGRATTESRSHGPCSRLAMRAPEPGNSSQRSPQRSAVLRA